MLTIIRCLKSENEPIFESADRFFRVIHYFLVRSLLEHCIEYKVAKVSHRSVRDEFHFAGRSSVNVLKGNASSVSFPSWVVF